MILIGFENLQAKSVRIVTNKLSRRLVEMPIFQFEMLESLQEVCIGVKLDPTVDYSVRVSRNQRQGREDPQ